MALRLLALFAVLLAVLAALLWARSPVRPETWLPGDNPGLAGIHQPNQRLAEAELLKPYEGIGPEDVLYARDGWVYTGYEDGQIVRFRPSSPMYSAQLFANTGGRPLGLAMDSAGNLVVADANRGLLAITPSGIVSVLVDSYQGERMRFVDDLDIATDGTIWFSDASRRFGYEQNLYNFFEASFTGRLFSYDPASDTTTLHMDGLFFANGVALGPNEDYVLVNETGMARIHRLWLKGNRQSQRDIFAENLPGLPDNLSFNGKDRFWVALVEPRQQLLDGLADKPLMRRVLAGLPPEWLVSPAHMGFVIALDLQGNAIESLQATEAAVHTVTSVNEHDGYLYLGSLAMGAPARLAYGNSK